MHVIALTPFYDLKDEVERKAGESFEVSKARYDELCSKGEFVAPDSEKEAPVTVQEKPKAAPKTARKTTTRRKAASK